MNKTKLSLRGVKRRSNLKCKQNGDRFDIFRHCSVNKLSVPLMEQLNNRAWYIITICTKNREMLFGEVVDGKMVLNDAGKIAEA